MKTQIETVKTHMLGAALGGVALYMIAKKSMHTGTAVSIAIGLVGVIAGANVHKMIKK